MKFVVFLREREAASEAVNLPLSRSSNGSSSTLDTAGSALSLSGWELSSPRVLLCSSSQGGGIFADSAGAGHGTTITFFLPLVQPPAPPEAPAATTTEEGPADPAGASASGVSVGAPPAAAEAFLPVEGAAAAFSPHSGSGAGGDLAPASHSSSAAAGGVSPASSAAVLRSSFESARDSSTPKPSAAAPTEAAAPSSSASRRAPPQQQPPLLRVLVAEDDRLSAMVLSRTLERSGLFSRVAVVSDGQEALDAWERASRVVGRRSSGGGSSDDGEEESFFHLVVADFNMPRLTGPQLARAVAASAAVSGAWTPVLVCLSGAVTPADRAACADAGFARLVPKPISAQALAELAECADAARESRAAWEREARGRREGAVAQKSRSGAHDD